MRRIRVTRHFLIVHTKDQSVDTDHEKHGFVRKWALSPENTGFKDVRVCAGVIPPGTVTTPHWHSSCETVIYVIQGRVKIHIGKGLEETYHAGPGDFIYVPKGVIHQTITLDEPCHYVQVVDNAEEGTVEYTPLRGGQPDELQHGAAFSPAVASHVTDPNAP
jgi:uncharacterized RmlC-like cupin family protein